MRTMRTIGTTRTTGYAWKHTGLTSPSSHHYCATNSLNAYSGRVSPDLRTSIRFCSETVSSRSRVNNLFQLPSAFNVSDPERGSKRVQGGCGVGTVLTRLRLS